MTSIREVAVGRHPSVQAVARWLDPNPNLPIHLLEISQVFHNVGVDMLEAIPEDDPQLTVALHHLVEAKDAAVRARLAMDEREE